MKTINYADFAAQLPDVVSDVTGLGEMVRVIDKNGGNFVVMEESECELMLEALRMVFAASASVTPDGEAISIAELNRNWGILQ